MNNIFKNIKVVFKNLCIVFCIINLALPLYAMNSLKTFSTHSAYGKISISSLQAYCDSPKTYKIESEIEISASKNLYSKTDKLIDWIKNYKYDGDDFCFYYILGITKKYISKIKPHDHHPIIEELNLYEYQDKQGRISFEDFKSCIIIILDKLR